MIRVARWVAVALFSVAVALTPLTATFSHSGFEAWFPRWGSFQQSRRSDRPHVRLRDRTGLVITMHAAGVEPEQNEPNDRLLVVSWLGGCSDQLIDMTFEAESDGYLISKRELTSNGCPFLVGLSRTIVLRLRQPVDAASVQFDALEGSVR